MKRERTNAERMEQYLQDMAAEWYAIGKLRDGKEKSERLDAINREYQALETDNLRLRVDQFFRELQESAGRNIKKT